MIFLFRKWSVLIILFRIFYSMLLISFDLPLLQGNPKLRHLKNPRTISKLKLLLSDLNKFISFSNNSATLTNSFASFGKRMFAKSDLKSFKSCFCFSSVRLNFSNSIFSLFYNCFYLLLFKSSFILLNIL